MRTIAIINQKGGVGKTSTTANLAHALALQGNRICVIDLDPQAQLTASLGFSTDAHHGLADVFTHHAAAAELVIAARPGLDLLAPGSRLAEFDMAGFTGRQAGWRLKGAMETLGGYDLCLIDCPPNSGLLAMNALIATHELLIPVAADHLSLQGAARLTAVVDNVSGRLELNLSRNYLLTRYDGRRRLSAQIRQKLEKQYGDELCATTIRECAAIAESPSFGRTIFEYRRNSAGGNDYRELAAEISTRGSANITLAETLPKGAEATAKSADIAVVDECGT